MKCLTSLLTFKVVGKAQATKSNLHNFGACWVLVLLDVSKILAQTLHACMNYKGKEKLNLSKYNCIINGPNCNRCCGKSMTMANLTLEEALMDVNAKFVDNG